MVEIKVLDGQNLFDIAIQNYGSLEQGLFKLLDDNNLTLDSNIEANQSILIDDSVTNSNKKYFQKENIIINNIDFEDVPAIVEDLSVTVVSIGNELFAGDGYININVNGGTKPYFTEWFNADNNLVSTKQNLVAASAGTYTVTVTDSAGIVRQISNLFIAIGDNAVYLVDSFGNLIVDGSGNPIRIG